MKKKNKKRTGLSESLSPSNVNSKLTFTSKKKLLGMLFFFLAAICLLAVRVFYIQAIEGPFLQAKAYEQQTRDRLIVPNRGAILDRNMIGIAKTETVASVSVIHNQVTNPEEVAKALSEKLELEYETVLKKVNKRVALERIKTKVDKTVADEIRMLNLKGVVVDEDIKRVYPFRTMASQVIGFVGKDNQGIIGLEAKYDEYLKGKSGKILTLTDVKGREINGGQEKRVEPQNGYNLVTSLDSVLQQYAEQTIDKIITAKDAKRGAIILMDPVNGEILAMANKPDFDLNVPFTINSSELLFSWNSFTDEERSNMLNQMWRNYTINDTYEPGSTFKIITSAAGLEEGLVTPESTFSCSGSLTVGGRQIKCWRYPRSHGAESFVEGVQNSCNPVFMAVADRLGPETFYSYMTRFGFNEKTGIDLPGEAVGIMHKPDKIGPVELATMSFGQSFQITPLQLLRSASSIINGGYLITPHLGVQVIDDEGNIVEKFAYDNSRQVISKATSDTMREILESVVSEGTGAKTYIPGFRVGGKTATSEKLPRRSGKYIASFLAFAPADDPKLLALVIIDEPQGTYYGGQVAGPVMKEILENALPYLNIKPEYTEEEAKLVEEITLPNLINLSLNDAKKLLSDMGCSFEVIGEGEIVNQQFPLAGEVINKTSKIILYLQ